MARFRVPRFLRLLEEHRLVRGVTHGGARVRASGEELARVRVTIDRDRTAARVAHAQADAIARRICARAQRRDGRRATAFGPRAAVFAVSKVKI
eukprot:CAMPEP_0119174344 /NCGR_PEP_ID=MMETSP1315-20130426/38027_1 /TAXON_ID=676789 /ORGANISM="Prasinoderma singularis, Strain RCC927" /LENGTH=93 /DNA_ID=CAMNT_0007168357 /DNA_START=13 /DNA_END=291 /DNA_ORIENTATION=+